jgi:hypothetical protein
VASFEIVIASGKAYCRGGQSNCCCNGRKIPKDTKSLRISIHAAGGNATSFYCFKCMIPLLNNMQEVLEKA